MSEKMVNALAKMKQVYLESVCLTTEEEQKLIEEQMVKINEYKKPKLDPVDKQDADIDNDGDVDETDDYLRNRRQVRTNAIVSDQLTRDIVSAIKNWKNERGTHNSTASAENVEKIMQSIKGLKPPVVKEQHYSWRDTIDENVLLEIVDDTNEEEGQIKENPKINNYTKKNPVVTINPEYATEAVLIDSEELTEEFFDAAVDIAAQYFYEEGLNEDGVSILMEELGAEDFYEWVMEIGYEYLLYEETLQGELLTSKGQARKKPEVSKRAGAASVVKHTPSTQEPKTSPTIKPSTGQLSLDFNQKPTPRSGGRGFTPSTTPRPRRQLTGAGAAKQAKKTERRKRFETNLKRQKTLRANISAAEKVSKPSKITSAGRVSQSQPEDNRPGRKTRKRSAALEVALKNQPQEKPTLPPGQQRIISNVRRTVSSATSPQTVRSTVADLVTLATRERQAAQAFRQAGGGPKGVVAGLRSFLLKNEFDNWVNDLLDEGYDLSDYTWDELYEEFEVLHEKAVSEQQQKLFGLALSVKRGETPRSKVSDEVLKIVDTMSEEEIRKYAGTPHEGIPQKVDEEKLVDKVIQFVRENKNYC